MASLNKNDVTRRRRDMARVRWEALRRSDDYNKEYDQLFRAVFDPKIKLDDIKTIEDRERYDRYVQKFEKKHGEGPSVTKADLKSIAEVAADPMKKCDYSNVTFEVAAFCKIWGIRYPKNPNENFKAPRDYSLFLNDHAVYLIEQSADLQAFGQLKALQMMEYWLKKRPLVQGIPKGMIEAFRARGIENSNLIEENGEMILWYPGLACEKDRLLFESASDFVRNDSQALKKIAQKKRDAGYLTVLVNINEPKDVILGEIEHILNFYQKGRNKKRWRAPDPRLFEAWDLKRKNIPDSETKTGLNFVERHTLGNWHNKAKEMLAEAEAPRNARKDKDGAFIL